MSPAYITLLFFISFLLLQMAAAICLLLFFRNGKKTGVVLTFVLAAVLSLTLVLAFRSFWLQSMRGPSDGIAFDGEIKRILSDIPMKDEVTTETEPETTEGTQDETEMSSTIPEEPEPETEPEPTRIKIVAIGDMLMHPQVSGLYYVNGSLDYTNIFKPIKDDVANADIAIVNNEVPFGGNQFGLQNYPNFNVVTELGDAEAATGFNVILNATNHVRDMGTSGVLNTIEFWKKYPDVVTVGVHESQADQDTIRYIERNGVKIALFNYAYGLNAGYPFETPYLVDMLYDSEKARMKAQLAEAEREADFTIVFPHWGEEYHLQENGTQQAWAEFFTECGADLIIGTHPHCLEPVRTVTAPNGNTALCYYSLGNYISMQDETVAMLGGLAEITLVVTDDGVEIEDHGMQYLVTHYGYDMNGSYVLKLENYSRDLSYQHGIPTHGFSGDNGVNASHPFSYDMFYQIIREIGG